MAGIGFELRKLFRKEGLLNNLRAYAYSSMTTVGPMILCMSLIIILQYLMSRYDGSYMDWELYIATVSYCFIFSIVITSGISLLITRYVSDCLYTKDYRKLMSSYYGVLSLIIPLASIVSVLFLSQVQAGLAYKFSAYFFFIFLVIIWIQGVYLSALKDYVRIARSFFIGALSTVLVAWVLMKFFEVSTLLSSFIGLDVGFFIICLLTGLHFQQKFPKADPSVYYEFLQYFKKFPAMFFSGCLIYSGIYLHNFVYWFSDNGYVIGDAFRVYMFYDVPVFYAFLSVMPTLVTFVVSVETSFFEKFRHYYLNVLNDGTVQDIQNAKKQMQKTLVREISFLMEIQLLFTVLSIGVGILLLPKIGFTMQQLDLFIILALAYYLFIILFSLVHVLMYFDDQKGVFFVGLLFFVLNIVCTIVTMKLNYDGLGMFIASFVALLAVIGRLLYVLRNIDYYTFCAQPIYKKNSEPKGKTKRFKTSVATMLLVISLLATACSDVSDNSLEELKETGSAALAGEVSYRLVDDKRLYERDQDDSLKALYITVLPKEEEGNSFDWYQLNRQVDKELGQDLEVIVQEGLPDGAGPKAGMFEFDASQANASITVRGNSAWGRVQKSYRLKLYDDAGVYMDQRTLNLNKHIDDLSRLRNKLSFDLMETIPDMTSLRTQFVQLYVKDLSNGEKDAPYVDYGLYTHVEQPNKKFLKAHLLDPNGYLYKVKFFEFFRYPDQIKSTDDPTYDVARFEEILEIKGREEHEKLIEMLEAVNDYSIPIEETIEKYFDMDNFLTWTAVNILMDNMDTDANNFFLYSPLNVDKWYFLPWDYDGSWELQRNMNFIRPYQAGISNYWGVSLHNRYFRNQENVDKLTAKMEELYEHYINEETLSAHIDKYLGIVEPFVRRMPDIQYLPDHVSQYEEDIQRIINTPKNSMERYYEDLEKPKPFYMNPVVERDGRLYFDWGVSFDLQDDDLTYRITVARDKELKDIVHQNMELKDVSYSIPKPEPGRYFWLVDVVDSKGNQQYNFEIYLDHEGEKYYGVRDFEVN
ncbi:hypothetical protein J40TS1_18480 [Paenibacillus montaniterrae]|uniref:Spore coat protein n=1 Tax=Paenibacillus montaniterrae TaxID=429341 RepID=A0A920CWS4_9BACL|nr:exopolysaccharide Pel transporter PelG [Paenibacillus montaniterrae]GIP16206.1 hypothetical protein J40TS1_18480 [Paenibacillus montaniterrae]